MTLHQNRLSLNETLHYANLHYAESPEILDDPAAAMRRMVLYIDHLKQAYEDQIDHISRTSDALQNLLVELRKTHRLMQTNLDISERSNKILPVLKDLIEGSLAADLTELQNIYDALPDSAKLKNSDTMATKY